MPSRLLRKMGVNLLNISLLSLIVNQFFNDEFLGNGGYYLVLLLFLIALIPNLLVYVMSLSIVLPLVDSIIRVSGTFSELKYIIYFFLYFSIISKIIAEET